MTASNDPLLSGIAERSFSLVRKGFDPEEVRTYLQGLDQAVQAQDHLAGLDGEGTTAEGEVPTSTAELFSRVRHDDQRADRFAEADRRLAELQADQDALRAWFGEQGRADVNEVPGEVRDAAQRANALIRDAEAHAAEIMTRAQQPGGSTGDRWSDLGGHVARILGQAEGEASAIAAKATAEAADILQAAAQDRAVARDDLAQAQVAARAAVAEAEEHAASVYLAAEPRAREHVAQVLAASRGELDAINESLRQARARLTEVHTLVGRSLAEVGATPTLDEPDAFVISPAPAPGASAPAAQSADDFDPVPAPEVAAATEPVLAGPTTGSEPSEPEPELEPPTSTGSSVETDVLTATPSASPGQDRTGALAATESPIDDTTEPADATFEHADLGEQPAVSAEPGAESEDELAPSASLAGDSPSERPSWPFGSIPDADPVGAVTDSADPAVTDSPDPVEVVGTESADPDSSAPEQAAEDPESGTAEDSGGGWLSRFRSGKR